MIHMTLISKGRLHRWLCGLASMGLVLSLIGPAAASAQVASKTVTAKKAKKSKKQNAAAPIGNVAGEAMPVAHTPEDHGASSKNNSLQKATAAQTGEDDYIVAVINQDVVTNREVINRYRQVVDEAKQSQAKLPPTDQLLDQIIDTMITERALLMAAREKGVRVSDGEINQAVENIAAQNQMTTAQMRERVSQMGMDYAQWRAGLRDQLMIQRAKEMVVQSQIKISESEIDAAINQQKAAQSDAIANLNIAQLLIAIPEGSSSEQIKILNDQAQALLMQARSGISFSQLVQNYSNADKKDGGSLGLRASSSLPESFVNAVSTLQPGQVAPQLVRSDAGFHILKLLDRQNKNQGLTYVQTHARHILLKLDGQSSDAASKRLAAIRQQIVAGSLSFEQAAKKYSQDGSAPNGGDLGWASPGVFVPEFEAVLNQLAVGEISPPVVSRFGVHLMQVLDRRRVEMTTAQAREAARNVLRAQKSEQVVDDWIQEARGKAYIERRESPRL